MIVDENHPISDELKDSEIQFFILHNWPKQFPLFYFKIDEVPFKHQKFVQETLFDSIFQAFTYLLNWILCFFCRRESAMSSSKDPVFLIASFNFFILIPIIFSFFHFEIYQILSFKLTNSSFVSIFLITIIILIHDFVSMMGNESTGTCGVLYFISLSLDGMFFRSFLSLIVFILLGLTFLLHLKFFMRIFYFFKGCKIPFSQFDAITERVFTLILSYTS